MMTLMREDHLILNCMIWKYGNGCYGQNDFTREYGFSFSAIRKALCNVANGILFVRNTHGQSQLLALHSTP